MLSSYDSDKVELLDRELESDKVELELALDRTLEMLDTIFPAPSEKKNFKIIGRLNGLTFLALTEALGDTNFDLCVCRCRSFNV